MHSPKIIYIYLAIPKTIGRNMSNYNPYALITGQQFESQQNLTGFLGNDELLENNDGENSNIIAQEEQSITEQPQGEQNIVESPQESNITLYKSALNSHESNSSIIQEQEVQNVTEQPQEEQNIVESPHEGSATLYESVLLNNPSGNNSHENNNNIIQEEQSVTEQLSLSIKIVPPVLMKIVPFMYKFF